MSTGELLSIDPLELKFSFVLRKQVSCSLQLSNKTDNYVGFKFNKGAGHVVEERKLKVIYLSPPQPPSPVHEGSEEGSSPRGSVSDSSEFAMAAKAINERLEAQDISPEVRVRITKLTEEKNSAIQQSNKLRQELVSGMDFPKKSHGTRNSRSATILLSV
ncbi:hypothetical protein V6N13_074394 [Hibiscus sabdariffa]